MRIKLIILVFLLISVSLTSAQNQRQIDSLKNALQSELAANRAVPMLKLANQYRKRSADTSRLYAIQALKLASTFKIDTVQVLCWIELGNSYIRMNPDTAFHFAQKAFEKADSINYLSGKAEAIYLFGFYNYIKGQLNKTLENNLSLVEIYKKLKDDKRLATTYNSLGVVNKNLGNYDEAVKYYIEASKIHEKRKDSIPLARTLSNLGNVYFYYGKDLQKAIVNYDKALSIFRSKDQKREIGMNLNNLGLLYSNEKIKDYEKALDYLNEAEQIFKKINFLYGLATTYQHKGRIYSHQKKFTTALKTLNKSLDINVEIQNTKEVAFTLQTIAELFFELGEYQSALQKYLEAMDIAQTSNFDKMAMDMYKDISNCYEKIGNLSMALEYHRKYSDIKDSTFTNESLKQVRELETKYETEKKENEIKMKEQQLQVKNLEIEKNEADRERQQIVIYVTFAGLLIVISFSVIVFRQYREKRAANQILFKQNIRINQANEEIRAQNEEIQYQKQYVEKQRDEIQHQKTVVEKHRDEIAVKSKQITDSIQYAKRIQSAILPPNGILEDSIPEHFIFYMPKDIVSGDFYWIAKEGEEIFVAAADCTGHGVPGAFMSMLGLSFLNEIVRSEKGLSAAEILERLRANIISSLRQTGKVGEAKDGMDIALVKINLKTLSGQFSGAYNPLYIIRNNELEQIKADKMPIGIYFKEKFFTNHDIEFEVGDYIYIFSDGFVDQFGGPKNQKYMTKRFKNLLIEIHQQPMLSQQERLAQELENWRGAKEQLDDVLIIGLGL